MTNAIPIGEQIGAIVATMRTDADQPPFYMYGHRNELNQRLLDKDKKVAQREKKYPLIILILDVPESKVGDVVNYNLHLAIITHKKGEKNAEQRITETIEPILYDLYETFLAAVVNAGVFMWPGDPTRPSHIKFDRPNWGLPGNEKNEAQYFTDPVDAVELVNLALNQPECYELTLPESTMALPDGIVIDKGTWNPNLNSDQLPTFLGIEKGWEYHIVLLDPETPWIIGGVTIWDGYKIRAKITSPGQDINNWWYDQA